MDEQSQAANHWEEEPAPSYDRPKQKKMTGTKKHKKKKPAKNGGKSSQPGGQSVWERGHGPRE